jgi:hypothetical protein
MIKRSFASAYIYRKIYFVFIIAAALLHSCSAVNIKSTSENRTNESNKINETENIEDQNAILTEVIFYGAGTWTAVPIDSQPSFTLTPDLAIQECKSTLLSRLKIGDRIETILEEDNQLRVRDKAGLEGQILYRVPNNTIAVITDGPKCVNEIIWWQINIEDNRSGWVAEFQDETYLLKPIKKD